MEQVSILEQLEYIQIMDQIVYSFCDKKADTAEQTCTDRGMSVA